MTNLSIESLIILANEFEQVSQESMRTMPAPITKTEPTKRSPGIEESPVTQRQPKKDEPYESQMDFKQIAEKVHSFAKSITTPNDRIGHIKDTDYAGHYFGVVGHSPAQAFHIYKRIVLFLRQHYPVPEVNAPPPDYTDFRTDMPIFQKENSSAGLGWLELRYPEDDCVITLRHFGQDVTFKITTIEQ